MTDARRVDNLSADCSFVCLCVCSISFTIRRNLWSPPILQAFKHQVVRSNTIHKRQQLLRVRVSSHVKSARMPCSLYYHQLLLNGVGLLYLQRFTPDPISACERCQQGEGRASPFTLDRIDWGGSSLVTESTFQIRMTTRAMQIALSKFIECISSPF